MPTSVSVGEAKRGAIVNTDSFRVEYKAGQDTLLLGIQVSDDICTSLTQAQQEGYFRVIVHNGPAAQEAQAVTAGNPVQPTGSPGVILADHACGFPFYGGGPHTIWLWKVMRAGDVLTVEVTAGTPDGSSGGTSGQANISFIALPLADFNLPSLFGRLR